MPNPSSPNQPATERKSPFGDETKEERWNSYEKPLPKAPSHPIDPEKPAPPSQSDSPDRGVASAAPGLEP